MQHLLLSQPNLHSADASRLRRARHRRQLTRKRKEALSQALVAHSLPSSADPFRSIPSANICFDLQLPMVSPAFLKDAPRGRAVWANTLMDQKRMATCGAKVPKPQQKQNGSRVQAGWNPFCQRLGRKPGGSLALGRELSRLDLNSDSSVQPGSCLTDKQAFTQSSTPWLKRESQHVQGHPDFKHEIGHPVVFGVWCTARLAYGDNGSLDQGFAS